MILVDSSVWIDHLRAADERLQALLLEGQAMVHAFVIGEIALGNLRQRADILAYLQLLPQAVLATDEEVLAFIAANALAGCGIGYVDTHLLAAARLNALRIWTKDKRLHEVALRLDLADMPAH